jgi:uncharacterized protein (DUF1697 family)
VLWLALLRGASPQNAPSAALKRAFEQAGFADVRTVLSSGNVIFSSRGSEPTVQRLAAQALLTSLGRPFELHLRPVDALRALVDADPFAAFTIGPGAKRVVTFLRSPAPTDAVLPAPRDGVHIRATRDREVFTTYVPHLSGPRFMIELERAFGVDQTTRTWDSLRKCLAAAG